MLRRPIIWCITLKFTVEYNFNSNHIECNTLTYGQTELLFLFGKVSGEGDLKDFVAQEIKYDIDFAEEQSPDVWWYDGQRIAFRSKTTAILLKAMKENPDITIEELSKEAGIAATAVKKQLQQMIKKGYIQRQEKDGGWYVFATLSI